ncbi:DUF6726 family protein [Nitratiruptor tergarcus]|uniref:Lipoprotein n=1 Tax=Nitratiruptor tergarcus DSM 16512 TaxID=1069081 RepID=A0A1W1WU69_9BACT|nr:DUF6726 family protein [Nitratiruptor tergarcus]SMC09868.1 hypothetical protein SAMN05660197_1690 [Nitratiruptor tergarcus DSM 16512]
MKKLLVSLVIVLMFSGCGIGSIVAAPFKVTGAVVNIVAPQAVGNTIAGVGDVAEDAIPF